MGACFSLAQEGVQSALKDSLGKSVHLAPVVRHGAFAMQSWTHRCKDGVVRGEGAVFSHYPALGDRSVTSLEEDMALTNVFADQNERRTTVNTHNLECSPLLSEKLTRLSHNTL